MSVLLAIDQGTTGSKALLMDESLKVLGEGYAPFPQHFPKPGWVEHDLGEIWVSVSASIAAAMEKAGHPKIDAIGITNQRETVCFWEKGGTRPIARAIVWQDRRTADECEALKRAGHEPLFQEKTGLLLDPYFSGTKIAWALKNWSDVDSAARAGRLACGTIDSYLMARLSGGIAHVTEPSNASRTLLFGLRSLSWDAELAKILGVDLGILPKVLDSGGEFARTKGVGFLPDGIPVMGCLGDQQAALLGQAGVKEGSAKCTYGTGAFLLFQTGAKPVVSKSRMLTTVAWKWKGKPADYALEGSAFIAGAAIQWLRDGLGLIRESSEIGPLAASVKSSDGLTFVPALTGLGAPHWEPRATGLFTGITRGTTRAHFARAVLEGIAFQNVEILRAMERDVGHPLASLNVDGGASASDILMQIQADLLGVPLKRPAILGTTAVGAVFAAGLGAGIYPDTGAIERAWKLEREFKPSFSGEARAKEEKRWTRAVEMVRRGARLADGKS